MSGAESERSRSSAQRFFVKPRQWVPLETEPVGRTGTLGTIRLPYGRLERVDQQEREVVDFCVTVPAWALDVSDHRFQRLQQFALLLDYDLLPDSDDFVGLLYHGFTKSGESYPFISAEALSLVINDPIQLAKLLRSLEPTTAADDEVGFTDERGAFQVLAQAGTVLSPERQAWLLLALMSDAENCGPLQLLEHLHRGKRQKNQTKSAFLDQLVAETQREQEYVAGFTQQSQSNEAAGATEKQLNQQEVNRRVAHSVAPLIVNTAALLHFHQAKPTPESKLNLDQADKLLGTARNIIGQKKYQLPKNAQPLPKRSDIEAGKLQRTEADTRRFMNEDLTEALRQQLAELRSSATDVLSQSSRTDYISALLQLQKGNFKHAESTAIIASVPQILSKKVALLSHREIAILMAMELELKTRPVGTAPLTKQEQQLLRVTNELHQLGLYFINATLSQVHDPMMLHMSGGTFCFVHTPAQLTMLNAMSAQIQGLTATLPSFKPSPAGFGFGEFFASGAATAAQGVPLFAQAFVAAAGIGFSVGSGSSAASERPRKKATAGATFGFGGSRRAKSTPARRVPRKASGGGAFGVASAQREKKPSVKPVTKQLVKPKLRRVLVGRSASTGAEFKQKTQPLLKSEKKPQSHSPKRQVSAPPVELKPGPARIEKRPKTTPERPPQRKKQIKTSNVIVLLSRQQRVVHAEVKVVAQEKKNIVTSQSKNTAVIKRVTEKRRTIGAAEQKSKPAVKSVARERIITSASTQKHEHTAATSRVQKIEKKPSVVKSAKQPLQKNTFEKIEKKAKTAEFATVFSLPLVAAGLLRWRAADPVKNQLQKSQRKQVNAEVDRVPAVLKKPELDLLTNRRQKSQQQKPQTHSPQDVARAATRQLSPEFLIDVTDSFNTAREVKMWVHAALSTPKGTRNTLSPRRKLQQHNVI